MSLQSVRDFFRARGLDIPILELEVRTATVALAADAHGVEQGRIAKTLAFRLSDGQPILLVTSGDERIDNRKFKAALGKARTLQDFDEVLPAAGSVHSALRIPTQLLAEITTGQWIDFCLRA